MRILRAKFLPKSKIRPSGSSSELGDLGGKSFAFPSRPQIKTKSLRTYLFSGDLGGNRTRDFLDENQTS